jgi:large subunit ribosomal protein L21
LHLDDKLGTITAIMAFAIIKTGGKQYKVSEGDVLRIEKLADARTGDKVTFDEVLLVDRDGKVEIGSPMVSGAKVTAEVVEEGKGKKITIVHYKAKSRYQTINGHRQPYAKVKITSI